MCGIIGIISKSDVSRRILDGLKKIEYRGYDSAGIALIPTNQKQNNKEIDYIRSAGKLKNLDEKFRKNPISGLVGIGHTRWATHGAPTDENAHPHIVKGVAIAHNGIIENYLTIKSDLLKKQASFASQTDSEVIAQLLVYSEESDIIQKMRSVLAEIKGAFAFIAIEASNPNRILFARNGSPLAIGKATNGDIVIGSDAQAVSPWCNKVLFLEDGDYGFVSLDEIAIYDEKHNKCTRKEHAIDASVEIGRGRHRHFTHKEIFEQPTVIANTFMPLIVPVAGNEKDQLLDFGVGVDWLKTKRIFMTACGTAFYAAMSAAQWFESVAGIPVELCLASELIYRDLILEDDCLAIMVSQSGETKDTIEAARFLQKKGAKTLAVVNVDNSSISRICDHYVLTHAGPEVGVASTKAFTTQLTALLCLALQAGRSRDFISQDSLNAHITEVRSMPALISEILHQEKKFIDLGEDLSRSDYCLFMGRGSLYPIALEGALKLKEISYIFAEGYAAGEMKHGPIALVQNDIPVIVLLSSEDVLLSKTVNNACEAAARGGKIILIGDENSLSYASKHVDYWRKISLSSGGKLILPMLSTVAVQLIAYHTARAKGTDIDQPRNLAKSVTVE